MVKNYWQIAKWVGGGFGGKCGGSSCRLDRSALLLSNLKSTSAPAGLLSSKSKSLNLRQGRRGDERNGRPV